jgi:hypothetical protein
MTMLESTAKCSASFARRFKDRNDSFETQRQGMEFRFRRNQAESIATSSGNMISRLKEL